jgi:hypothetical protein
MGHIKEPKGVDFVINSRPLTKKEEIAISEYIRAYKANKLQKPAKPRRIKKTAFTKSPVV